MPEDTKKKKRKVGRPPIFNKDLPKKTIEIAKSSIGVIPVQVGKEIFHVDIPPLNFVNACAREFKVSSSTIKYWKQEHEEFLSAFNLALEIWQVRLDAFASSTRMPFPYYKSYMWQTKQIEVEPKNVATVSLGLTLADAKALNKED